MNVSLRNGIFWDSFILIEDQGFFHQLFIGFFTARIPLDSAENILGFFSILRIQLLGIGIFAGFFRDGFDC